MSTRTAARARGGFATIKHYHPRRRPRRHQQARQADDLDRQAVRAQRLRHGCGIGVAPHQHRRRRRAPARRPARGTARPVGRRPNPRSATTSDSSARSGRFRIGAGPWTQGPDGHRPAPGTGGQLVGHVQRARQIAPAGPQFQRSRAAVGESGKSVWNRGRLVAEAPRQP